MIIEVMNRQKARSESFRNLTTSTAIISITDITSNPNSFTSQPWLKFVKKFQFDDEDKGHPNCMTKAQAEEIASFVRDIKGKVDRIIVHCEAGISRSAGVAAAIMKFLNGDDMAIFSNPKFCPNMTCYRMVLEALVGSVDNAECDAKFAFNLEQYKKANPLDFFR